MTGSCMAASNSRRKAGISRKKDTGRCSKDQPQKEGICVIFHFDPRNREDFVCLFPTFLQYVFFDFILFFRFLFYLFERMMYNEKTQAQNMLLNDIIMRLYIWRPQNPFLQCLIIWNVRSSA